jgi:hypothetical protein
LPHTFSKLYLKTGNCTLCSSPSFSWNSRLTILRHSVVTTVRSQEKADKIAEAYPNVGKDKLDFAIVEDIAVEGAFEDAVKSDPPFEAVVCTFEQVWIMDEMLISLCIASYC